MYERTSETLHYTLANLTLCKKPYSLTVMMTHFTLAFPTAILVISFVAMHLSLTTEFATPLWKSIFYPALSLQERGMALCMLRNFPSASHAVHLLSKASEIFFLIITWLHNMVACAIRGMSVIGFTLHKLRCSVVLFNKKLAQKRTSCINSGAKISCVHFV